MNSGSLAYDETLPAYAEGLPACGEALAVVDAPEDPEHFDRGKDWPLAFVVFTPVIATYAAVVFGLYLVASTVL